MESTSQVTPIELTRQERLELHMRRSGLTYRKIGAMTDITGQSAARHLRAETIPPRHHEVWITILPADLLPAPAWIKPGPKAKSDQPDDQQAAA
jgi:DNA topoisomerase IB